MAWRQIHTDGRDFRGFAKDPSEIHPAWLGYSIGRWNAETFIVETIGRRSGKRYRIPVGFLEESGKLIVVAEDGLHSSWVRNALARDGHLRVFLHGSWRDARLQPRPDDPEPYLRRMNKVHAAFVRTESSDPALIEIMPE